MLIDARELDQGTLLEADVCVVGGGAAGIMLAIELKDSGLSVVLLESGGFQYDPASQALYGGNETGSYLRPESEYLTVTRLRHFGGTTGHWGGWCRPHDPEDFERRSWVENSGWPLERTDLDPHYEHVNRALDLPPFDDAANTAGLPLIFPPEAAFETTLMHVNAVRFSRRYGRVLRRAKRKAVRVAMYANLTEIEVDENAARVEAVAAATLDGVRFRVRARSYVLATGGIENARLLLASNRVAENGLGNDHDWVGRCFMEHPFVRVGHLVAVDPRLTHGDDPYSSRPSSLRTARLYGLLRLRAEAQRRHRLLNGLVLLSRIGHRGFPELTREVNRLAGELTETEESPQTPTWEVHFAGEQIPNRASRVHLIDERDALGMPRSGLDWRLSDQDTDNVHRTCQLLAAEIGASLGGRLRLLPERDDPFARWDWSKHHMGTTRMAADPKQGVVDLDSRVHGIANLYVAGSSVFPTAGCSNPTLTLLALTVRLARHLEGSLSG